jgi:fructose-1,6-bisphosphatase/inositol monophosphatase family enzyme
MNTGTIHLQYIGEKMMEMLTTAIEIIRNESHEMIVENKAHYDLTKEDVVTNGDRKAQAMYIQEITHLFPTFGVIAEEKELTIPCAVPDTDIYFTVDPLDGTKAYARGQSHGVGTMIALIKDGNVIAAYIGDVNTGEIYGFADDTTEGEVFRHRFGKRTILVPNERELKEQYLLLREAPGIHPEVIQHLMRKPENGGLFKNIEIGGGSIGTHIARLWKGEVGGIVLEPGFKTPWDEAPVVGILKRLGFVFYHINDQGGFVKYEPYLNKTIVKDDFTLIIHRQHEAQLLAWKQNQKK